MTLHNRTILLIISGGIAAYKSLDLIRRLRERGARVNVVLTQGGEKFVTSLSVEALSENPVYTDLWATTAATTMPHIKLARETDLIVIAPASANLLSKMAEGRADDLASTLLLANTKPVMIAPAMNVEMWRHPATQSNIQKLTQRGVELIHPATGLMACGETGEGRMAEPTLLLESIVKHFEKPGPLSGKRALVTSGPTYEPLDPVRFLGNRSSGKQGHALAEALRDAGADVTLVTGPVALPDPTGIHTVRVETAQEMLAACENTFPVDIVVCAAAVADWRPATYDAHKIKKSGGDPVIKLVENPDILATLSRHAHRPRLVIGFAAETMNLEEYATAKRARKGCDWLLANDVSGHQAFGQDENQVTLFRGDAAPETWPRQSKKLLARQVVDTIISTLKA